MLNFQLTTKEINVMVNAWSLLDSEINGTMDEDYPTMSEKEKDVTVLGGATNEYGQKHSRYYYEYDRNDSDRENPFVDFGPPADAGTLNLGTLSAPAGEDTLNFSIGSAGVYGGLGEDHFAITGTGMTAWDDPKYYASEVDPIYAYHFPGTDTIPSKPQPNLNYKSQKYEEDKGIKDLKDYVSSTYSGHYTNDRSDVQTLDLIHSVGDAESFCRSNALKYLSRYDKKGSAKNDILKAMHYCLLLYNFSGNTQEPDYTNTRYETF